jgi:hypothetical protein
MNVNSKLGTKSNEELAEDQMDSQRSVDSQHLHPITFWSSNQNFLHGIMIPSLRLPDRQWFEPMDEKLYGKFMIQENFHRRPILETCLSPFLIVSEIHAR